MALQNVAWALTGRGLMNCLQYYDNCLFLLAVVLILLNNIFLDINYLILSCFTVSQGQAFLTVISGYNITKIVYSRANLDTPSGEAGFTAAYDTTGLLLLVLYW
jgi:hypothetical protein